MTRRRVVTAAGLAVAAITATATFGGCAKKAPSALVVAISTEGDVPRDIDGFEIEVDRAGAQPFFETYELGGSGSTARLPGTITLTNRDDEDTTDAATVIIRARLAGKDRVLRQATLGFSSEKTKLLRMPLRWSCYDFKDECAPGQSCKGGVCADDATDVASLPEFDRAQVDDTPGGPCFDASTAGCLAQAVTVDMKTLMATADCAFSINVSTATGGGLGSTPLGGKHPLDATAGTTVNVAVHYALDVDPAGLTVLDVDAQEGWQFADDGHTSVRLAAGLCGLVKSGAIAGAVWSPRCAPKSPNQAVCREQASGSTGGPDAGAAGSGGASTGSDGGSDVGAGAGGSGLGGASGSGGGGAAGSSSTPTCTTCSQTKCSQPLTACAQNAACSVCIQSDGKSAGCTTDALWGAYSSCACSSCAASCGATICG